MARKGIDEFGQRAFILEWEQWRVTNWNRSLDQIGNVNAFLAARRTVPASGRCESKCRRYHNRRCQLERGHRTTFHRSGSHYWIDNGIKQVGVKLGSE